MGWDNTKPADNRKWDLAAGDIRDNWDYMESIWGVDLLNGTGGSVSIRPGFSDVVGDGFTDDTDAINAILAGLVDGDTVVFSNATYLCDNLAAITGLTGLTFIGYGVTLLAQIATAADGGCFTFNTCIKTKVSGFNFDRQNSYTVGSRMHGVEIIGCDTVHVEDCIFDECEHGVRSASGASKDVHINNCRMIGRLTYTAQRETDNVLAQYLALMTLTNSGTVTSNYCEKAGVFFGGDASDYTLCQYIDIVGNVSKDSNDSPLYGIGSHLSFRGNTVVNCGKDAIKCIGIDGGSQHCSIIGNKIFGTGAIKTSSGAAITMRGDYGTVSGNVIQYLPATTASDQSGIVIRGTNHTITGNVSDGETDSGDVHIHIFVIDNIDASKNLVIQGNVCSGGTSGAVVGVEITGTSVTDEVSSVIIADNIFKNVNFGIKVNGNSTKPAQNVTVKNNIIDDYSNSAYRFEHLSEAIVVGNSALNNDSASSAYTVVSSTDMIFKGNTTNDGEAVSLEPGDFITYTLGDTDQTPTVFGSDVWETGTTGVLITRFDDGVKGDIKTFISKGAIVYNTSAATRLIGSSVNITTADGDTTQWVCEIGGTTASSWRLLGFVDVSQNNSSAAEGIYGA